MIETIPDFHPMHVRVPAKIEGFGQLAELALDLRSSWNHGGDNLWRQLDATLWDLTQNPWVVLQTVSRVHLERKLADPAFRKEVDELLKAKHDAEDFPGWFQQTHPDWHGILRHLRARRGCVCGGLGRAERVR